MQIATHQSQPNDAGIFIATIRANEYARSVGMAHEQMERFLSFGYVPQPMQMRFHGAARSCDLEGGPDQVGVGGARGPGKSHAVFAQIALDDCQRIPGLKVLYLRKLGKNAQEQLDDLRRVVLRMAPHKYNHKGTITFPNGSRIVLGHFRTEGDIDHYLGMEYDIIVIEEATTLTKTKYKALRDSNRTSKPGWRPRIYNSTNPGGVGHAWYKELFILPARTGKETDTRFIPGTVDDNQFIDSGYKSKLEGNVGWRLRAYRFGDWDIAAGMFFTTWRHEVHVRECERIPGQPVWGGFDYGKTHRTVFHLITEHDGSIYVLDEYAQAGQLPESNARGIIELLTRHKLTPAELDSIQAGHDVFAQNADRHGETIADQYGSLGLNLWRANNDRINGAAKILGLLGDVDREIEPHLFVSPRCAGLVRCLPNLLHDKNRPEDVLKVNADDEGNGGDDEYDAFRYGVMINRWQGAI